MNIIKWDGAPISKPGVYSGVPIGIYHGGRLCDGPSISSSGLRTIFTKSEMDYWIYSPLNPKRLVQEDKDAFILGRATHHLALGEENFGRSFAVQPETYGANKKKWNNNAAECQNWNDSVLAQGYSILTRAQVEQIHGMCGVLPWQKDLEDCGLANNKLVQMGLLNGLIEHTVAMEAEGVWLLARPDAIPVDSTVAADLKTAREVDLPSIRRSISEYRYDMQAAIVRECLRHAANVDIETFAFAFVKSKPTHAVNVREISAREMDDAFLDVVAALRTFKRCLDTGKWRPPGAGQHDGDTVTLTKWAQDLRAARHKELSE